MLPPKDSLLENSQKDILGYFSPSYLLTFIRDKVNLDIFPKEILANIAVSSTITHERMHWNQFFGTTWGNICLLIKQCQIDNFPDWNQFQDLKGILHELKDITILDNYQIHPNIRYKSRESGIFLQQWRDNALTYELFTHDIPITKKILSASESVACALSDYYTTISDYFDIEEQIIIAEIDNLCNFKQLIFPKISHNATPLTVSDLLEGQARASEIIFSLNTLNLLDEIGMITHQEYLNYIYPFICETPYWRAFQDYLFISKKEVAKPFEFLKRLTEFCIIIDISLSVPWPPYVSPKIMGQLPWKLFYPVYRFFIICNVVKEIEEEIHDVFNFSSHLEYYEIICNCLNWPTPRQLAENYLEISSDKYYNFAAQWENEDFNGDNITIHDYYYYIFRNFCELRIKSPTYIPNLGLTQIGSFSNIDLEYICGVGSNKYWIDSPLQLREKSNKILTKLKTSQFNWISLNLLHNVIMNDYVLQFKPISFRDFFFDVPDYALHKLNSLILDEYGISILK